MYFNLRDLQTGCDFKTKFCASAEWFRKMEKTWLEVFDGVGIPPSHLYRPVHGHEIGDVRLDNHFASVAATMVILLHGSESIREKADKVSCVNVLTGCLHQFGAGNLSFQVDENILPNAEWSFDSGYVVRLVENRIICEQLHLNMPVVDALLQSWKRRDKDPWRIRALLCGIAHAVDRNLVCDRWSSDASVCLHAKGFKRQRTVRHLRQVLAEVPLTVARNENKLAKAGRKMGLKLPSHRSWVDISWVRRYIIASRYRTRGTGALSFGICLDKGRRTGRDWLRGAFYTYESRAAGMLTPVVHARGSLPKRKMDPRYALRSWPAPWSKRLLRSRSLLLRSCGLVVLWCKTVKIRPCKNL